MIRPMLAVGTRAPEFTLQDQDGREVSLTSLLDRGRLVLYFYPADFTPGCTREACTIRDLHEDLAAAGINVAGISPDTPDRHHRFRATHELPFTLLCDPDKEVIKMYDVNGPLGFGVRRATYLIDTGRTIRDAVLADFRIGAHENFIRKLLAVHVAR